MPKYIAFLRAINVGGHTVKMERLRTLFQELGHMEVETFIASGNVIFSSLETDTAALEAQIETHLQTALGYAVETFLRTPKELADICALSLFTYSDSDETKPTLSVIFLRHTLPDTVQTALSAMGTETDEFSIHGREAYWLCRGNIGRSNAGLQMGKVLTVPGTSRNITTVRRLAEKYSSAP